MRKSVLAVTLAAVSTLVLASCAMPADQPGYNGAGGGSGGSSGAVGGSSDVVKAAMTAPTSIGVTAALSKAPAKGATIISIVDDTAGDAALTASMTAAAKTLGWTLKTVVVPVADLTKSDAAFNAAVAAKPAGIHISGAFANTVSGSIAKDTTVPVICTGCAGAPTGELKDTSINGDTDNTAWATDLAAYTNVKQAPNENANVTVFALPSTALDTFNTQFASKLLGFCPGCSAVNASVDLTQVKLSDAAGVGKAISGEMANATGNWALLDSGSFSSGVAKAMAENTSGQLLGAVVTIGRGASAADITNLKAIGKAADGASAADASSRTAAQATALQAWEAISLPIEGWRVMDQFARVIGGQALATAPLTSQLLTGSNAGTAVVDKAGAFLGVADYQAQFKKLWGVA